MYKATRQDADGKDVTMTLVAKAINKGDYKGTPYWALPDCTPETRDTLLRFLGADVFDKWITNQVNQIAIQAMYANAKYGPKDEEGFEPIISVDWDKVVESIEELSSAAETLPELKDRKIALLEEMKNLFATDLFGNDAAKAAAAKTRCESIRTEVQSLDLAIKAREDEFAKRQQKAQQKKMEAMKEKAPVAEQVAA